MRVGLISDTHDNVALAQVAADWFAAQRLPRVLHLGDITSPAGAAPFSGLPITFLRGNNDLSPGLDEKLKRQGFTPPLDEWREEIVGVRIAAAHGHVRGSIDRLAKEHDLVLHGHTHRRRHERINGGALIVNPGALHLTFSRSIATIDLPTLEVRFYGVAASGITPLPKV